MVRKLEAQNLFFPVFVNRMKYGDDPIFFHVDSHAVVRDLQIRNRSVLSIVRIDHYVLFDVGTPVPVKFGDALQIIDTGIPTVKHDETGLKSPGSCSRNHLTKIIVLRHLVTIFVVNPVIEGRGIDSIGPDQGNEADPFHDFVVPPAPLIIGQFNVFRTDFVR